MSRKSMIELAAEYGITSAQSGQSFLPYKEVEGKIEVDLAKAEANLAQDAAMVTVANIGAPAALYTYIDPRVIPILFAAKNSTKFFKDQKIGEWTDEFLTFQTEEVAGQVGVYSDYGDGPSSDVNFGYPVRQNFRFQTTIKYGDLEVEKASRAKLNLVASKQRSASEILARARNKFNLYGVKGMSIYGMLNDPNLPSPITPQEVGGKTKWAEKCAAAPSEAANIVYNDVNLLITELMKANGAMLEQDAEFVLGVSNNMFAYLTNSNMYGKTAQQMLKENYPNLEIVQLPELSTKQGETLYLTVRSLLSQETGAAGYTDAMKFGRLVPHLSSFSQKACATTCGTVIFRPSLVAQMLGI